MASCHTHAAFKLSLYSSARVRGYGKMYYPPNTKEGCVGGVSKLPYSKKITKP